MRSLSPTSVLALLVVACAPASRTAAGPDCGFGACAAGELCVEWGSLPFDECAEACVPGMTCDDGCPCVAFVSGGGACADACRVWDSCLDGCVSLTTPWGCAPGILGTCDARYREMECKLDCDQRLGCTRCGTPADRCSSEGMVRCECPAEHGFTCHYESSAYAECETAPADPALSAWLAANARPIHQGIAAALVRPAEPTIFGATGTSGGRPVTTEDQFRIASVTKVFVATLVLTLLDDRAFALDDSVLDYGVDVGDPRVTVRHLLAHQSELPDYLEARGFVRGTAHTPAQLLAVGQSSALSMPGLRFGYSNTNYIALGMLIERVTGASLENVLRARVIDPLGLTSTYLADRETGAAPLSGVTWTGGGHIDTEGSVHPSNAWAAGGLVSNLRDMVRAMDGLLAERSLLAESTAREMVTPTVDGGYGLGAYAMPLCGGAEVVYAHDGNYPGAACAFVGFQPSTGVGVVLLSQTDDGASCASISEIACELARVSAAF